MQATALIDAAALSGPEGITIANKRIAIDSGCPAVRVKLKAGKRSTKVTASWRKCGTAKKVQLKGAIINTCTQLTGSVRARKRKAVRIAAGLTRCGDGLVDTAGGETDRKSVV